jgi:hypothetical protein
MSRFFVCLVVHALVVTSAAAQALQNGNIILLQNTSGSYLSADPVNERLYPSSNTAGWEQWMYNGKSNHLLTSIHGTTISLTKGPAPHTASFYLDPIYELAPLSLHTGSGDYGWKPTNAPPANGDTVMIYAENRQVLSEWNGSVTLLSQTWGAPVADNARWKVTIATSPDPKRLPLQKALNDTYNYFLKSSTNDYLQFDLLTKTTTAQRFLPGPATHRPQRPEAFQPKIRVNTSPIRPLLFGTAVWIDWIYDGGTVHMQPDPAHQAVVVGGGAEVAETQWTVVDPTGLHPNGNRVPLGAKICLRSGLTNISADPGSPNLRLSQNCSAWESWTTEERQ